MKFNFFHFFKIPISVKPRQDCCLDRYGGVAILVNRSRSPFLQKLVKILRKQSMFPNWSYFRKFFKTFFKILIIWSLMRLLWPMFRQLPLLTWCNLPKHQRLRGPNLSLIGITQIHRLKSPGLKLITQVFFLTRTLSGS